MGWDNNYNRQLNCPTTSYKVLILLRDYKRRLNVNTLLGVINGMCAMHEGRKCSETKISYSLADLQPYSCVRNTSHLQTNSSSYPFDLAIIIKTK